MLSKEAKELPTLPPKRAEDTETAWADPWSATRESRQIVMSRLITDEINRDPAEVKRLTKARQDARAGHLYPRHDGTKSI